MFGDCDNCGHSVMYHVPLAGCIKCDCEEFCARIYSMYDKFLNNFR